MINVMVNFLRSIWFNVILSVLAGFFAVMQEAWLGGFERLNVIILGICCAIGFSFAAEVIKIVFTNFDSYGKYWWNWKTFAYGAVPGVVIALITGLLI